MLTAEELEVLLETEMMDPPMIRAVRMESPERAIPELITERRMIQDAEHGEGIQDDAGDGAGGQQ